MSVDSYHINDLLFGTNVTSACGIGGTVGDGYENYGLLRRYTV